MITGTGQFADLQLLGPLIKKYYMAGLEGGIPDDQKQFFSVEKSDRETEDLLSIGDTEPIGEFTGQLDYDQVKENYRKRITNTEYARGLAIQRKLWETGQQRVIRRLSEHFGEKVKLRILTDSYALLNNAFSEVYTGGDGKALCDTAHTSNVGGSNQGNEGTTALSAVAVDSTYVLMVQFNTNNDNPRFDTKPDTIIVPTALEAYAAEIVGSKGKVDSANNNINFYYGKFKVIGSRMLTDQNNWFMANAKRMRENQVWFNVVRHEFNKDRDFNSFALRWSVYMFYGFGFNDWDHIYGHAVS